MPVMPLSYRNSNRGVSLIEVLISIVLISIVLLGVAALALNSMNENQSAYYRSQANAIAYDIADRIRLNSSFAVADNDNYEFNTATSALPGAVNCSIAAGGCTSAQQGVQDIREWTDNFFDVAGVGVDGADYQALIPNASGTITRSDSDPEQVTVTVIWQESDWQITAGDNKAIRNHQLELTFMVFN